MLDAASSRHPLPTPCDTRPDVRNSRSAARRTDRTPAWRCRRRRSACGGPGSWRRSSAACRPESRSRPPRSSAPARSRSPPSRALENRRRVSISRPGIGQSLAQQPRLGRVGRDHADRRGPTRRCRPAPAPCAHDQLGLAAIEPAFAVGLELLRRSRPRRVDELQRRLGQRTAATPGKSASTMLRRPPGRPSDAAS